MRKENKEAYHIGWAQHFGQCRSGYLVGRRRLRLGFLATFRIRFYHFRVQKHIAGRQLVSWIPQPRIAYPSIPLLPERQFTRTRVRPKSLRIRAEDRLPQRVLLLRRFLLLLLAIVRLLFRLRPLFKGEKFPLPFHLLKLDTLGLATLANEIYARWRTQSAVTATILDRFLLPEPERSGVYVGPDTCRTSEQYWGIVVFLRIVTLLLTLNYCFFVKEIWI